MVLEVRLGVVGRACGKTSGYGGPLRGNGDASLTGPRITFSIEI